MSEHKETFRVKLWISTVEILKKYHGDNCCRVSNAFSYNSVRNMAVLIVKSCGWEHRELFLKLSK